MSLRLKIFQSNFWELKTKHKIFLLGGRLAGGWRTVADGWRTVLRPKPSAENPLYIYSFEKADGADGFIPLLLHTGKGGGKNTRARTSAALMIGLP